MSFTDHKITQFTHRIVDLPDQPNLPADELKARFDSSPEELRQAVNGICDDAATLSGKVDSILAETFDGVVEKSMLSEALADELDAKAVETSVASRFTAEQTARESADSSLSNQLASQISSVNSAVNSRARVATGSYTGNTTLPRTISFPFSPKVVVVAPQGGGYARVVLQGKTCYHGSGDIATLSGSTLTIVDDALNDSNDDHFWFALA